MPDFRAPRLDLPLDLEGNLRLLPEGARCRGMYFNDILDRTRPLSTDARVASLASIPERRYLAFLEYPYGDFLRLLVAAAGIVHPSVPAAEGVHRFGLHAYDALLGSHAGRVIFGVLGLDAERILLQGHRGYRLAVNFGKVTAERAGDRHAVYRFEAFPAFLETFQLGVIEGALNHCKVQHEVRIALDGLANAMVDITWR